MKTFALFILIAIFNISGFSQDTLYTTKGKIITGQVKEITQHEIKYKRAANPDGPLYVVDKTDIVLIHYKNGTKEVFENSGAASSNVSSNDNSSDPVYVNTRPRVNVVVGAAPIYAFGGSWGWGWGGWGWNRPYYGGYYRSYGHHHWHHNHHNHFGHYGRRGGGRR